MLTLGVAGGLDRIDQRREYLFPRGTYHDAAAVLVEDGRVIAAVEEERLNRIKHTSKGAINAIRFCLSHHGVRLHDVDAVAYYGSEEGCTRLVTNIFYGSCEAEPVTTPRALILDLLRDSTGEQPDDRKLMFVHHHLAHAAASYLQSGFPESLVLTLDGAGDGLSGSVTVWQGSRYAVLHQIPASESLGTLYDRVIQVIGYGFTEEYKVMGLAPYGDPSRYRQAFKQLYSLEPQGKYTIRWDALERLYPLVPLRKRADPIIQEHVDLAAALQETLERIVFHVLTCFRGSTGLTALCLGGGVAHNSTLNGRILYSGLFRKVFVHPASHDAGCAVGAAFAPYMAPLDGTPAVSSTPRPARIESVYWGPDAGADEVVASRLHGWRDLLDIEQEERIAARAAAALAEGRVIGWVQGRSEFGPRALGNRSILADPRPPGNKDRINEMVKKREGYRPFAPSVLEEYVREYFDIPGEQVWFPFMSFTVDVRPQHRATLGATTHVDGSARIQTVSRTTNPLFWELIDEFRQLTGVPVLLNTSFNNNAEPIVDSVDDAVVCFLTTGLDSLVVGRYFLTKKARHDVRTLQLRLSLPRHARLMKRKAFGHDGAVVEHVLADTYSDRELPVSSVVADLVFGCSVHAVGETLEHTPGSDRDAVARELFDLWTRRAIVLTPP